MKLRNYKQLIIIIQIDLQIIWLNAYQIELEFDNVIGGIGNE